MILISTKELRSPRSSIKSKRQGKGVFFVVVFLNHRAKLPETQQNLDRVEANRLETSEDAPKPFSPTNL